MIYVIGVASSGRESLTGRALRLIEKSDIVIGSKRFLCDFDDLKGEIFFLERGLMAALLLIEKNTDKRIAFLATGDPLHFGVGTLLVTRFGKKMVTVLPNVSIVQEAFARLTESLNGVKVLSVHGGKDNGKRALKNAVEEILECGRAAVFTDSLNTPSKVASKLLEYGAGSCRVVVFERLGTEKEKITRGTLKRIAKMKFDALNLMVIFMEESSMETEPRGFGFPNTAFSSDGGMITKEEVRSVALSKLRLRKHMTFWDIGAGSGSVSIEASRIISPALAYAVERVPKRVLDIEGNKLRFGCDNLRVVTGEAPAALKGLPAPERVFVGGGGGNCKALREILRTVSRRIPVGGRIVVNAVTVETFDETLNFFKRGSFDFEVVTVNIAKTKTVNHINLLTAANPVHVITGVKL